LKPIAPHKQGLALSFVASTKVAVAHRGVTTMLGTIERKHVKEEREVIRLSGVDCTMGIARLVGEGGQHSLVVPCTEGSVMDVVRIGCWGEGLFCREFVEWWGVYRLVWMLPRYPSTATPFLGAHRIGGPSDGEWETRRSAPAVSQMGPPCPEVRQDDERAESIKGGKYFIIPIQGADV
jgi:hypothetical protein